MKLDYSREGLQFFFVTLVVAERQSVLSRLGDTGRPALSPLGAMVRAALGAVHKVWSAATVSDYVIMPDHVHYLLILDHGGTRGTPPPSPLYISHRLADAVETAFARVEERTGASPPHPSDAAAEKALYRRRVDCMARLLAAADAAARTAPLLKVEHGLRFGALVAAKRSLGKGAGAPNPENSPTLGKGAGAPEPPSVPARRIVFARDCYIELSFDSRQLKAIRRYIALNPDRARWKAAHPDLFACHRGIRAARLARFAPRRFDGIGALTLLGSPFLFHVRLTMKKSVAEHAAAIDEIVEKARRGMVPVSGFISPGEREALRRLKAEPLARFIRLLPHALPERYDPSAEDSRELAAGRLAILSPFPDTPHIPPLEMRRNPSAAHEFRRNCLAMNDIAASLCAQDQE